VLEGFKIAGSLRPAARQGVVGVLEPLCALMSCAGNVCPPSLPNLIRQENGNLKKKQHNKTNRKNKQKTPLPQKYKWLL